MARNATPSTSRIHNIALIYRTWFLYIEPVFALGVCIFQPDRFLQGTVPLPALQSLSKSNIAPLTQLLLTNIGSLYILFAINEGLVLRLTSEKNLWMGIIFAIVVSDIGHLWAAYEIAPMRMGDVMAWNSDEWVNYGTLWFGLLLRVGFLVGFGRD